MISVVGNVNVAAGATLDAQSAPSTITVGRNVIGAAGSLLGLGCQPPSYTGNSAHPCTVEPDGHSTITVKGNVTAIDADTVLLNGVTVKGNVTLLGGGGDIPWSIKNNTIGRNLTVSGQTTEWLGVLFNKIGGNATLTQHHGDRRRPGRPRRLHRAQHGRAEPHLPGWPRECPEASSPARQLVGGHAIGQCACLV